MSDSKMTDRDILVEVRSEMKLQTKILYAVVAAIVGVKFIPQSPIDIVGSVRYALQFLLVAVGVFIVLRLWEFRERVKPAFAVAIGSFMAIMLATVAHSFYDGAVELLLNGLRILLLGSLFWCAKTMDKHGFAVRGPGDG